MPTKKFPKILSWSKKGFPSQRRSPNLDNLPSNKSRHSFTMPTATTSKPALAGTKRKSLPVHVKASKKPKIELKSALKSGKPAKKVAPKDDPDNFSDSDDVESDGGAKLGGKAEEEEEDEEENEINEDDGVHPDRVKAVVTSSMSFLPSFLQPN